LIGGNGITALARVHVDPEDLAVETAQALGIPIVVAKAFRDLERILRDLLDVPVRISSIGVVIRSEQDT
jgi:hypothetical protein